NNPNGIITAKYCDVNDADQFISACNNSVFGSKVLSAEVWDGREKFYVKESEDDAEKRIENWHKEIE
ncbi:MAG: HIV Tat-specific factor 1, partial [Paramarteilia canceri]